MRVFSVLAILAVVMSSAISQAKLANNEYKNVRIESCSNDQSGPHVYSSDFNWNMSLPEIVSKSQEIYVSKKRLKNRAWFDGRDVVMKANTGLVRLSPRFLTSVSKHIEAAFARGYIDAVIFPDMGHSHFFIPKKFYKEVLQPIPNDQRHKMYELLLDHPQLKILYHTAEQIKMVGEDKLPIVDRKTQWRFYTRNLVGGNRGQGHMELLHEPESSHNTSHDYDKNHTYYGAGFNISASVDGCFSYERDGKTFYFDLSFDDLQADPNAGGGDIYF